MSGPRNWFGSSWYKFTFIELVLHWFVTGISCYEAKLTLVRDAMRAYLAAPRFLLPTA